MKKHYDWDNYLSFITEVPVSQDSLTFFSARPSAAAYLDTGAYRPIPWLSRLEKEDNSTDTFFSRAINSEETIPRVLAILRKEILEPSSSSKSGSGSAGSSIVPSIEKGKGDGKERPPPDQVLFVQLGSGLNGFTDTVHGGVLASLVDESLSTCVEAFRQQLTGESKVKLYTANLNVSYRAPVMSPGVILVKSWLKGREGRKWFMEAVVEDEQGRVCVDVKALWISERAASL